jgi:ATP-dependent Lon protease
MSSIGGPGSGRMRMDGDDAKHARARGRPDGFAEEDEGDPLGDALEQALGDQAGIFAPEEIEELERLPAIHDLLHGADAVGVVPVRDSVLFPRTIVPLRVAAPWSTVVSGGGRIVAVVKQKDPPEAQPAVPALEDVGCLAAVLRVAELPDGTSSVLLQGLRRVRLVGLAQTGDELGARVEALDEREPAGPEARALLMTARGQLQALHDMLPQIPWQVFEVARRLRTPGALADIVVSFVDLSPQDAQGLLAETDGNVRLRCVIERIERELHVMTLGKEIREQAQRSITEAQTEIILREQLEAIQRRLGDADGDDLTQLRHRLDAAHLPEDARKEVDRELARLQRMPTQAAEHGVIRTYLEWMADLPWAVTSQDRFDLDHARRVLDEDHHGLHEIKDHILDFLAVRRFRPQAPSPILCLVGPPGTGKTSLGRSIARAVGRRYARASLGGVGDEAEIRGHRRTYVGAMPGRIVSVLRRAGTRNPVLVLDEIDKVGRDLRGDPYSALLEVLDPEQNAGFVDNYLGTAFDLSGVMFVCTANVLEPIPSPLLDRMEVVHLPGYTPLEKLEIARRHILPRKLAELGLGDQSLVGTVDAIDLLIAGYTREAGVRELERQIARLLRKTARHLASDEPPQRRIDAARVRQLLGKPRFLDTELPPLDRPGTALGLAWTPVGGEVLVVEAVAQHGGDGLVLTGQLGDVMKESATAALSYLRARAEELGVTGDFTKSRIHLHVPAGAIPKDGPSAGVAMFVALASLATGRLPIQSVAMTGEITLQGRVLPVAGIREKVLGAHRLGLRTVLLPRRNEADLDDVPEDVRAAMRFVLVDEAPDLLGVALHPPGVAA